MSFFWQCTVPYLQIPHIIHHHPTSSTCLFRAQESANESKLFGHRYFFGIRRFNFVQGVPVEVPIFGWGWQIFSSNIELPKVDSFFYVDLFSSGAQAKGVPFLFVTVCHNWKGQHFNLWQPDAHPVCFLPRSLRLCLGLRRQTLSPQVLRPVLTVLVSKSVTRAFSLVNILHLPSLHSTCKGLLKMTNQHRKQMSDVMGCQRMSKEFALQDGTPQAGLAATIKSRVTQWRDALTLERHIAW